MTWPLIIGAVSAAGLFVKSLADDALSQDEGEQDNEIWDLIDEADDHINEFALVLNEDGEQIAAGQIIQVNIKKSSVVFDTAVFEDGESRKSGTRFRAWSPKVGDELVIID